MQHPKLNFSNKQSVFSLTLFLYLPQAKRENMQLLIKFFQKHQLKIEPFEEKKGVNSLSFLFHHANFVVRSCYGFTDLEFKHVASFFFSNTTVIALFYKNQVWSFSRLEALKKTSPSVVNFTKNLKKICF